MKKDLTP